MQAILLIASNHHWLAARSRVRVVVRDNLYTRGSDDDRVSERSLDLIPGLPILPVVLWCNCRQLPRVVPKYDCTDLVLSGQNPQPMEMQRYAHYFPEIGPDSTRMHPQK